MAIRRKKMLPFLSDRKEKGLFLAINVFLMIGAISFLVSVIYMLKHFSSIDSIIVKCIPGFILAICSGIIYFAGYQALASKSPKVKH